jgi:putative phosphoribosyl transferase
MTARFLDRRDAGRQLAQVLMDRELRDPVVLALPRGGVPVGYEIALQLDAPLEVFVARKLGAPGHPELGIGAIAEGGTRVINEMAVQALRVTPGQLDQIVAREEAELERRVDEYRHGRPLPELGDRDVVLVDDGLATGVTAEAALVALRRRDPRRLVLAVPACAPDTAARLRGVADDVVCVISPREFHAVGLWYDAFDQTTDGEVQSLLAAAAGLAR